MVAGSTRLDLDGGRIATHDAALAVYLQISLSFDPVTMVVLMGREVLSISLGSKAVVDFQLKRCLHFFFVALPLTVAKEVVVVFKELQSSLSGEW
ncbi:hypothetical protein LOK49_LG05G02315 [Camellia lanceoleosa]|uniref:Uncharacterized protein n=1 Tax=Camellia lanceoleosa TaxID=1840588 RepID=A0ACC0HMZ8_9ERIC|nr:hypothetical protein LOK49_LG05G02315 [Camellia lanceoleosa]